MQTLFPQLINVLADGQFHTGDALGSRFGVSKTSVWKAIGGLEALGLDVHSVRGKGYRLSEQLCLLSEGVIRSRLEPAVSAALAGMDILLEIDSTNSHLLRQLQAGVLEPRGDAMHAVLAERQSAGRGRRGRSWVSPFGQNIYLSLLTTFEGGAGALSGLSLVAGLAVAEALRARGVRGLGLKWPNDVLCFERKLGGVLLEISGDLQSRCHVVLGVGLNVRVRAEDMSGVEQPWTDLASQGTDTMSRNIIVASLLNSLVAAVTLFRERGFGAFQDRWRQFDLSVDRPLQILEGSNTVRGVGQGVDDSGALLVQTDAGLRKFHGGEVSLRLKSRDGT